MKKQTAVEWLVEQIFFNRKYITYEESIVFEKAKAMEKEQLIEAYADGQYLNSVSLTKRMCLDNAESYFNETYGGDK